MACTFILTRGPRAGTPCGRNHTRNSVYCSQHAYIMATTRREETRPAPVVNVTIADMIEMDMYMLFQRYSTDHQHSETPLDILNTMSIVIRSMIQEVVRQIHQQEEAGQSQPVRKLTFRTSQMETCDDASQKECPVCYGTNKLIVLGCDHSVCVSCLKRLETGNCPYCRTEIVPSDCRRYVERK